MKRELNLWSDIGKVFIISDHLSAEKLKDLKKGITESGLNIHEVDIVFIAEDQLKTAEEKSSRHAVPFSMKEIGFFGKIKNEEFVKLLSKKYDVIVFLGELPERMYRILRKLKSKYTIGIDQSGAQVQINLKTDNGLPSKQLAYAKETLEKISLR